MDLFLQILSLGEKKSDRRVDCFWWKWPRKQWRTLDLSKPSIWKVNFVNRHSRKNEEKNLKLDTNIRWLTCNMKVRKYLCYISTFYLHFWDCDHLQKLPVKLMDFRKNSYTSSHLYLNSKSWRVPEKINRLE